MNSKLRRAVMVAQVEEHWATDSKNDILLARVCFVVKFKNTNTELRYTSRA